MKKLPQVTNGEHHAAGRLRAALFALTTVTLGTMFWVATTPIVQAQNMSPAKMIESQLPPGKTVGTADKAELLSAVCAAVKKYRPAAPQIVRFAVDTHPEWKNDILRSAFRCLGADDCLLLGRVLLAVISGDPNDANELTELALELAPDCAGAFSDGKTALNDGKTAIPPGEGDEDSFGPPGNLNPPPGSVGGGGAQGNVISVCFNGVTRFFSPEGAEEFLNNNPGATLGACQVTQFQNN